MANLENAGNSANQQGTGTVGSTTQPCPLKKVKLVELVEVVDRGAGWGYVQGAGDTTSKKTKICKRDKIGDYFRQFINLDRDVEGAPLRRPDYGRAVYLRARVEWVRGDKKRSLAGRKVFWTVEVVKGLGRPVLVVDAEREGFSAAGGAMKFESTCDADGWTEEVAFFLSQYGGDAFTIAAQADADDTGVASGVIKKTAKYQVWRRFWFQMTHGQELAPPDPRGSVDAYQVVCAEMLKTTTKQFKKTEAPACTYYPEWMVKQGSNATTEVSVIGAHNKAHFFALFTAEPAKPVKGHLVVCAYQWDPGSAPSGMFDVVVHSSPSEEIDLDLGESNAQLVKPPLQGALVDAGTWEDADGNTGALDDSCFIIEKGRSSPTSVKVKLPVGAPNPATKEVHVKFSLNYALSFLGESVQHNMLIVYDRNDRQDYFDTITHEFGHGFNQTPVPTKQPASFGDHPKQYTGCGGIGSHCSTEAQLVGPVGNKEYSGGSCVLFHCGCAKCKHKYCETCAPYVRMQDMSHLG